MPKHISGAPALAFISNSCPPYRLHALRRIAREIPQIRLFSVFTHEISSAAWAFDPPQEIGPISFGAGESSARQGKLRFSWHEWCKAGRIIRWMQRQNVRAVVIAGYSDLGRLRIIHWCSRRGMPCLLHGDSNALSNRAGGIWAIAKKLVLPRILRRCRVVLPCGSLGEQYFQRYGVRPSRMFLMPVEPDYQLIGDVQAPVIEEARQRFGLVKGRYRLIYSGRLAPEKRVDLLLDAFSRVAPGHPDWDLVIVGSGDLKTSLAARVPAALQDRVIWTGFLGDQLIVNALYHLCDVLVLPSDYEPWALVINEAAASGLAIVASDVVGAAAELVRDGVNGRIFNHGHVDHLTQCLESAMDLQRIDALKAASLRLLREWREKADPIEGLRRALRYANVIPHSSSTHADQSKSADSGPPIA